MTRRQQIARVTTRRTACGAVAGFSYVLSLIALVAMLFFADRLGLPPEWRPDGPPSGLRRWLWLVTIIAVIFTVASVALAWFSALPDPVDRRPVRWLPVTLKAFGLWIVLGMPVLLVAGFIALAQSFAG
jgi:hypothetical protein